MNIIPKFQNGGELDQHFTVFKAIEKPQQLQQAATASDSKEEKGKLQEKDFFDMIKDIDGLPNEMNLIVRNLVETFQIAEQTGMSPSSLSTTYLLNLYQVKIAAQNKKKYDEALKVASERGSLSEYAIDMDGKVMVQTKDGNITSIEYNTLAKSDGDYMPLTVSQLARLRAYSPQFNNNQNVFDIINNSIGFEGFQELVDKAKTSLGTTQHIEAILQVIETARDNEIDNVNDLYKLKLISKNQKDQLNSLLDYIVLNFPNRAKTWALMKTNISDKNAATRALVERYLFAGTSETISKDVSNKPTGGNNSDNNSDLKETFLTSLQTGLQGNEGRFSILPGNNGALSVNGDYYGAILNLNDEIISNANLNDVLTQSGIAGITNRKSITFGNQLLNENALSQIVVENSGGVRVILPCIKNGQMTVPNFELIESFDKLVQEVNNELGSQTSHNKRMLLLEQKIKNVPELQELLDMSGHLDKDKVGLFFVLDGLTSDANIKNVEDNIYASKTNDQNDVNYYQQVTKASGLEELDTFEWYKPADWFGWFDDLYRSSVFIPLQNNNRLAAAIFSGLRVKENTALNLEHEHLRSMIQPKKNIWQSDNL